MSSNIEEARKTHVSYITHFLRFQKAREKMQSTCTKILHIYMLCIQTILSDFLSSSNLHLFNQTQTCIQNSLIK